MVSGKKHCNVGQAANRFDNDTQRVFQVKITEIGTFLYLGDIWARGDKSTPGQRNYEYSIYSKGIPAFALSILVFKVLDSLIDGGVASRRGELLDTK